MTEYKKSVVFDGFIKPDFDFDECDPVFPTTTPSNVTYKFDLNSHYFQFKESLNSSDAVLITRQLAFLKAALINNSTQVNEIISIEEISRILFNLINPKQNNLILYEALCTAVALTGIVSESSEYFENQEFINFLIRITIISLSDPNFDGNRSIGTASLAFLRNLLYNSNECRVFFIMANGVDLISTLYFEIFDHNHDHMIWVLINMLSVDPTPTIEMLFPICNLLKNILGYSLPSAESTEIILCIKYVTLSPEIALNFLKEFDLKYISSSFHKTSEATQVQLLELFKLLILCPHELVSEQSFHNIKWNTFLIKIPKIGDKKVELKLCEMSCEIFQSDSKIVQKILETELLLVLMKLVNNARYVVKVKALTALNCTLHSNQPFITMLICGPKMIKEIVHFLDSDWAECIHFGVETLLLILEFALNGKMKKEVLKECVEYELEEAVNEQLDKELPEELLEMCEVLRTRLSELTEICEYSEMEHEESEGEEEEHAQANEEFEEYEVVNEEEEEVEWIEADTYEDEMYAW
ncbi:hypothetical protein GPJ56_008969 [Histomonas meleagridis]|uniref:uncharacterized protein n=1 Tax=Histomonas meleagridis TaxID=135588 RepID=UPI003559931F|nr:hypothetical protein GPJ56_008969 [Histomonas meleagridis]KAH0805675.1 hypothetical protein GO595_001516 [Histomonas meleagridis]